jgi:hypothetical protein
MATEKKIKRERKISPAGEAKWAHIQTPKQGYDDGNGPKGEPKYMIDIVFDPTDPAWSAWMAELKAKILALPPQINRATGEAIPRQALLKRELDSSDHPTGRLYFTAKTSAKFKPGLFDARREPFPDGTLVGNGSTVKIAYTENEYTAFGGGINLYLEAVQVLRLVEFGGRSAADYGFAAEDGDCQDSGDSAPF